MTVDILSDALKKFDGEEKAFIARIACIVRHNGRSSQSTRPGHGCHLYLALGCRLSVII